MEIIDKLKALKSAIDNKELIIDPSDIDTQDKNGELYNYLVSCTVDGKKIELGFTSLLSIMFCEATKITPDEKQYLSLDGEDIFSLLDEVTEVGRLLSNIHKSIRKNWNSCTVSLSKRTSR